MRPDKRGYVRVYRPGHPVADRIGMAWEHRVVLYDAGVELPAGYHVHHKNEDKADNRIDNLEVLSPRDHVVHHIAERGGLALNQYGSWPLSTPEQARANSARRSREYRQRRAAARAEKAA